MQDIAALPRTMFYCLVDLKIPEFNHVSQTMQQKLCSGIMGSIAHEFPWALELLNNKTMKAASSNTILGRWVPLRTADWDILRYNLIVHHR